MEFTSLVNGPAQAGSSALAGAAIAASAAGGAAGPAAAGAGADGGFASLVALALGALGAPDGADGQAEPIAGRAKPHPAAAPCAEAEPALGEATAEAPDAATLAVLVALAAPPQPAAAPGPAAVPAAGVDGDLLAPAALVDGRLVVADVTAPAAAAPASTAPGSVAPAGAAAPTVGPSFSDALSAAEQAHAGAAGTAGDAPAAQAPAPDNGAPASATVAAAEPVASPAITSPAAGGAEPAAPAPQTPAPTATPQARAEGTAPAGPLRRPAVAPGRELRGAAREIRELAAGREAAAPATPATPAAPPANGPLAHGVPAQVSGNPTPDAAPAVARPAVVVAAASGVATMRPAAESRSDADTSGEGGADAGPLPASAIPTRPAAALDLRFDPVAPSPTASPAPLAPVAALTAPSPMAIGEALRAIELPASARLEQALATLDPETRNLQAIVRTVRLFTAGDGLSEARLELEPDHLGPVGLTVRVEQGSVSAHFRAETPAAQRWIETHQQELRAGLREQGLEVKDVVVTTDPDGRRDRRQEGQPARPSRQRRSAAAGADAPRFEVLV